MLHKEHMVLRKLKNSRDCILTLNYPNYDFYSLKGCIHRKVRNTNLRGTISPSRIDYKRVLKYAKKLLGQHKTSSKQKKTQNVLH